MTKRAGISSIAKRISLLVIVESPTLRELLRYILKKANFLAIEGEAINGSEVLDMLHRICPDVILLDPDMPFNDDMTLLQYVMSHQPTPTIILQSLTKTGLNKSFAALQNGAVDFIWQESIIENWDTGSFQKGLLDKVACASKIDVTSFASLESPKVEPKRSTKKQADIIFCEECGARNIFDASQTEEKEKRRCAQCGDLLQAHLINQYKRAHYVTVVAAGAGSYSNLLKIIPRVPAEMSGAIIIVLYDEDKYVDAFTEYLNTVSRIKVFRVKNNTSIEGGNCYIATASENFCMKPFSIRNTMAVTQKKQGYGPVDLLMISVSTVFKNNTAGLILSGIELDGDKGLNSIKNNNGISAVLFAANCLHRKMGENVLRQCKVDKIVDENDATGFIYALHDAARDSGSTA